MSFKGEGRRLWSDTATFCPDHGLVTCKEAVGQPAVELRRLRSVGGCGDSVSVLGATGGAVMEPKLDLALTR